MSTGTELLTSITDLQRQINCLQCPPQDHHGPDDRPADRRRPRRTTIL